MPRYTCRSKANTTSAHCCALRKHAWTWTLLWRVCYNTVVWTHVMCCVYSMIATNPNSIRIQTSTMVSVLFLAVHCIDSQIFVFVLKSWAFSRTTLWHYSVYHLWRNCWIVLKHSSFDNRSLKCSRLKMIIFEILCHTMLLLFFFVFVWLISQLIQLLYLSIINHSFSVNWEHRDYNKKELPMIRDECHKASKLSACFSIMKMTKTSNDMPIDDSCGMEKIFNVYAVLFLFNLYLWTSSTPPWRMQWIIEFALMFFFC